jgi:hypothetical protein
MVEFHVAHLQYSNLHDLSWWLRYQRGLNVGEMGQVLVLRLLFGGYGLAFWRRWDETLILKDDGFREVVGIVEEWLVEDAARY